MEIYKAPEIELLQQHYGDLLYFTSDLDSIEEYLNRLALRFYEGIQNQNKIQYIELNNYHPSFIGKSIEELKEESISLENCRECILYEFGYKDWNQVPTDSDLTKHLLFEKTLDLLLHGRIKELSDILNEYPDMVQLRSHYGHEATLLHYTGSNGVELWRQQVPLNLPEMIALLLEKGAKPEAKMKVYGGLHDTLSLLSTSAHPYKCGIAERAISILQKPLA